MNNLSKYYVNRAMPEEPDYLSAHILIDNESLLPPPEIWPWRYVPEKDQMGENEYYRVPYTTADEYILDRTQWTNMTPKLRDANNEPGEWAYEIIAFMSQANAAPVGTEPVGWFGVNTNINSLGLTTDASKPHLHPDIRQNHSFQEGTGSGLILLFCPPLSCPGWIGGDARPREENCDAT